MSQGERTINKSQAPFPEESPLAWALLGVIIERPGHGYELAQRFSQAYGETLPISGRRHIYRLLKPLQAHGLIEETSPGADEKPAPNRLPKPHYCVTPDGVRAYQQWLVSEMEEQRNRQRLFALQLSMLEPGTALSVVERYEQECLQEAGEPAEPEQIAPSGSNPVGVARRLADADERLALEVRLTWIEYARSELKALIRGRVGES